MCLLAMATPGLVIASESIVRQCVDAYNSQDLEAMLSLCADQVRWLAIDGEAVDVITKNKDELRSALQADFSASQITVVWYFPAWICDASEPRDE
jgi:hypothetical protein